MIRPLNLLACALAFMLVATTAWGYGGGGSGSGPAPCTNPGFLKPSLANGATVKSVDGFSFTATPNTLPDSLTVTFGKESGKVTINRLPSGYMEVSAQAPAPLRDPGKARVAINAKSSDGCEVVEVYWLTVDPNAP